MIKKIKKIRKTDEEWRELLTPDQYQVMRKKATERPFSCTWHKHKKGTYFCVACGLPLFRSETKFESGSGWPSYFAPIEPENVEEKPDYSFGMDRTEVVCARCGGHLGHVFPGEPAGPAGSPPPFEKRYCINSVALNFKPDQKNAKA